VGVVRDDRYLEHWTGIIHPEHPNRLKYVYGMVDAEFSGTLINIEPQPVTLADLEVVHTPTYVRTVIYTANRGLTHLAEDTPTSPGSYMAAWLAVGGCITALETLRSGECDVCFCLLRPPGHHAQRDRAGGFCIFNNLGVTARYALRKCDYKRILIVDWDVHHGNALQSLFYGEKEVLYISSHYTNIYPYAGEWEETGAGEGEGYNVNMVLTKAIEDLDLLYLYYEVVGEAIRRYQPDLILVPAGFDLHKQDIFGRAQITEKVFGMLTRLILDRKREIGDPPLLLALEGGYRIPALVKSVREVLKVLTDPDSAVKLPHESTPTGEQLLRTARSFHSKYGVWAD
ncbi:MAG TPA: histone deacetylase, partial [Desulfomonilaceae bacterium]|nr:histone deacetylase [Desulfomonilaceae bacterium]